MAVSQLHAGSSSYFTGSDNTYEDILGVGGADTWHHYTLKWDQDGLAEVPGQKVAVYFDDVLNSTSWNGAFSGTFPALPGGALNLITGNAGGGRIAIDGFKI